MNQIGKFPSQQKNVGNTKNQFVWDGKTSKDFERQTKVNDWPKVHPCKPWPNLTLNFNYNYLIWAKLITTIKNPDQKTMNIDEHVWKQKLVSTIKIVPLIC